MDSFFTVSKVFWFLAAPSNLPFLLAAIGLVLLLFRRVRAGTVLVTLSVLVTVVFGFSPLANYLQSPLEERFPQFHDDGRPVTGVILLGGAEEPAIGLARGQPTFSDAAERAIAFGALSRRYPDARLAFVGGSGRLFPDGTALEARMMRLTVPDLGIAPERVVFEENSRNTAENAAFARALLKPQPGERWLLVTSAIHMPRAMGCFRKAGFDVVAYPVDYRTIGPDQLDDWFSRSAMGLGATDAALREWIGLVVYYLTGKIGSLFPAP